MRKIAVLAAVLFAMLAVSPARAEVESSCSSGSSSTITMTTRAPDVDPSDPSVQEGTTSFTGTLVCTGSDGFFCGGKRCELDIITSVYLLVPAGPDYAGCLIGIATGDPTPCADVDLSRAGSLQRVAWPLPILNSAGNLCFFCNRVTATIGFPNVFQVPTGTPAGSITPPGIYEVESTFHVNFGGESHRYGQWIVTGVSDPIPVPGCDGSDASRTRANCLPSS